MINDMSLEEINSVYNISKTFTHYYKSIEYIKNDMLNTYSKYYTYSMNSEVVAFLHIHVLFDQIEIINIYVLEQYRNMGIGYSLIEYLFNRHSTINDYFLEVSSINLKAINLYKKIGFVVDNVRKNYYDDEYSSDAYIMKYEKKV